MVDGIEDWVLSELILLIRMFRNLLLGADSIVYTRSHKTLPSYGVTVNLLADVRDSLSMLGVQGFRGNIMSRCSKACSVGVSP